MQLVRERMSIWSQNFGIEPIAVELDAVAPSDRGNGFDLTFRVRERRGSRSEVRLHVDGTTGEIGSRGQFCHWSSVPTPQSRVLIAPDIIAYWGLVQAVGHCDILPFVIVAPIGSDVPFEWLDSKYWSFAEIVVLCDDAVDQAPVMSSLVNAASQQFRVAMVEGAASWRAWAQRRSIGRVDLEAVAGRAIPACEFARITAGREGLPASACPARALDEMGRLCRRVVVEDRCSGRMVGSRQFVVRSDRSCAEVVCWPPSAISGQLTPWARESLADLLRGFKFAGPELGASLSSVLSGAAGMNAADLSRLSAFVAMTYLYQALDELPLLVIRGGDAHTRMTLRRLLAQLCFSATTIARTRAAHMARIADARPGTLILEEPGALCGPSGSSEVGRLLESAVVRGASAYTRITGGASRQLDLFGPKLVIGASQRAAGLACHGEVITLADRITTPMMPSNAEVIELASNLQTWAMDSFFEARTRISAGGGSATRVLPAVEDLLTLNGGLSSVASSAAPQAQALQHSPADLMERIMRRCAAGGWISMAQVQLEIALTDRADDSLSPERVGRWMAARPEIDSGRAMQRRRLYGQVSRIYPLSAEGVEPGDATTAFEFCTGSVCRGCRYEPICDSTFPGMRSTKLRR